MANSDGLCPDPLETIAAYDVSFIGKYCPDLPVVDPSNTILNPTAKSAVYDSRAAFPNIQLLTESYSRKNVRLCVGLAVVQRIERENADEPMRMINKNMITRLDLARWGPSVNLVLGVSGALRDF